MSAPERGPVSVLGARSRSALTDPAAFVRRLREEALARGLQVQAFDADLVFGEDHLLSAWEKAERSFRRGTNVAQDKMVEVLLYAAGERQIATAIEKLGVKAGSDRLVLLVLGEADVDDLLGSLDLVRDDGLVAGRRDQLRAFGLTETELETVPAESVFDLVLERVALAEILR